MALERCVRAEEDRRYKECMQTIHNKIYLSYMRKFQEINDADRITVESN